MISKIQNFWLILKSSLWFIPAIFCFVYFILTLGIYVLEISYLDDIKLPPLFFNGGTSDAKSLAIALLSTMITMATLAISITMVVLSLSASQLGPRLIKTFMADRKTQTYIGLFFGAVIACFVLTMILYDAGPYQSNPRITITTVFAVCFANLFVLLAFVHHVAQSSIADNVILKVARDLAKAVERLTNKKVDFCPADQDGDGSEWPQDFEKKFERVHFERSGYVQHINYPELISLAQKHDLHIQIVFKAGHFLVQGENGVQIYPTADLKARDKKKDQDTYAQIDKAVRNCFIIGSTRTPTQDIEYSIRHLVEIAIRALSPGLDDSFTGMTVLDHMSAALAVLFQKETVSGVMADEEGVIRLNTKQSDETDILFSAFDQIRQSGRDNPAVTRHVLAKLLILASLARSDSQKAGISYQLDMIEFDLNALKDKMPNTGELQVQLNKVRKIIESENTNR